MRGHERLIEMRRAGKTPRYVFVNDYPCQTDWFETGDHATICTDGDSVELLDLRCLVGLTVSVSATSEARAKALLEACKRAGAAVVAACHVQADRHQFDQSGWSAIWRRNETEVA